MPTNPFLTPKQAKVAPFTITLTRENCALITFNVPENYSKNFIEVYCNYSQSTFTPMDWSYRILRNPEDQTARWTATPTDYVSEASIDAAQETISKSIRKIKTAINKGKKHPAYPSMLAIVKKDVKHYQSDFYFHDLWMLGKYSPTKFIWCVRESGTDIVPAYGDGWEYVVNAYNRKTDNSGTVYWWDGTSLAPIEHRDINKYYAIMGGGK
jgi:hypothetical protein